MNSSAINSAVSGSLSKIVAAIVVPIVKLVFVLAVFYFVWGAAGLILYKDNAEKRSQSQRHILWGIIGMVIMLGCYGIVRIIANTIGVASPV